MPSPVALYRLSDGRYDVRCGGCMRHNVTVSAPDEEAAWQEIERQGWTAYRWNEHSHAYAKCPACSGKPTTEPPKRKARRHR